MIRSVNVKANRNAQKWTRREQFGRVAWALATPFFRLSPRPLWAWRRLLLRWFGATIGADVHIYPSVRITIPWNLTLHDQCAIGDRVILYALGPIRIGPRATISQGVHLCAGTHDLSGSDRRLLKPPIDVDGDSWVAADAFVGPGVTVGKGAIVGARAVVMRDVPDAAVVAGNPAKIVRKTASRTEP